MIFLQSLTSEHSFLLLVFYMKLQFTWESKSFWNVKSSQIEAETFTLPQLLTVIVLASDLSVCAMILLEWAVQDILLIILINVEFVWELGSNEIVFFDQIREQKICFCSGYKKSAKQLCTEHTHYHPPYLFLQEVSVIPGNPNVGLQNWKNILEVLEFTFKQLSSCWYMQQHWRSKTKTRSWMILQNEATPSLKVKPLTSRFLFLYKSHASRRSWVVALRVGAAVTNPLEKYWINMLCF